MSPTAALGADSYCDPSVLGSPYIPVDSWVYPAMMRLYSLGFVQNVYLNMRPWTRASVSNMLEDAPDNIEDAGESAAAAQAKEIYDALQQFLHSGSDTACPSSVGQVHLESAYSIVREISGPVLRDSFHLGSTIVNDYGRPYESGVNNYSGLSGYATSGRFALYGRWEFEGVPSGAGYSLALGQELSNSVDLIPFINPATGVPYRQSTLPSGPISAVTNSRLIEGYVSAQVENHIFSFGKQDQWLGPATGASFAYSNNAENIYAFELNRIEPLNVPLLSRLTGPFRYEFLVGQLQGHTYVPNPAYEANPSPNVPNVINPGNPWVHLEKLSFNPTENLEFGFERTVIWGGKGHAPVTVHSFLKSFFSTSAPGGPGSTGPDQKFGRNDPGARFGAFDFSYRLPHLRNWLTLYADGEVHDDVSPIDAPRRASWRPGVYLSQIPGARRLDLRVEGVYTDPPVRTSNGGRFMYWETIQRQGYTNRGQLFGDWVGREDKGGQVWLTYHLSGGEWVQVNWRHQKSAKDFIPGGSTLNGFAVHVVKRLRPTIEMKATFDLDAWKAPLYRAGTQTVTATSFQITWSPSHFHCF